MDYLLLKALPEPTRVLTSTPSSSGFNAVLLVFMTAFLNLTAFSPRFVSFIVANQWQY